MSSKIKEFENVTKILSGNKSLDSIPFELVALGAKSPLLISEDLIEKLGLLKRVVKAFDNGDIVIERIFTKVPDIATTEIVEVLVKLYNEENCDSIVAVGRSSVIAVAKAVKFMINQGSSNFNEIKPANVISDSIPLFVVPVFLGCGQEAINTANIYDLRQSKSYEIKSANASTTAVFIDKRMTDKVPIGLILSSYMYIIATSISACESNKTGEIAKVYAHTAIQIIIDQIKNLSNANKGLYNVSIVESMIYSGIAKDDAGIELIDILAKTISRTKKIPYEKVYTIIFMHYFKELIKRDGTSRKELSHIISGYQEFNDSDDNNCLYTALEQIFEKLSKQAGLDLRLRSLNVERIEFAKIAELVSCDADNKKVQEFDFQDIFNILDQVY